MAKKIEDVNQLFETISQVCSEHGETQLSKIFQSIQSYDPDGDNAESAKLLTEAGGLNRENKSKMGDIMGMLLATQMVRQFPNADLRELIHNAGYKAYQSHKASIAKMAERVEKIGTVSEPIVPVSLAIEGGYLTAMIICFAAVSILEQKGVIKEQD